MLQNYIFKVVSNKSKLQSTKKIENRLKSGMPGTTQFRIICLPISYLEAQGLEYMKL
jgi:hypothetical protein